MLLSEFFEDILPANHYYFAAQPSTFTTNDGRTVNYFKHIACASPKELAIHCKILSRDGHDAFFALSGFEQKKYQDEHGKWRRRTKENAVEAQSCWLDIDCGENKPYPDKKSAIKALKAFIDNHSLPPPTYIVDSGNGIHVYWGFTKPAPKPAWEAAASILQALCENARFAVDPKRTTDIASVLRPPGTRNWKDPDNPKEVKILRAGKKVRFSKWGKRLLVLKRSLMLTPIAPTRRRGGKLSGGMIYPPSEAGRIAQKCAVLKAMQDTKGANQTEPEWRACLSVLKRTQSGEAIAHEWSKGYPNYDQAECQNKLDNIQAGPAKCDTFRQICAECTGCPHNVTSPIVLGYPPAQHVEQTPEGEKLPPLPEAVSKRFAYNPQRGGLLMNDTNSDGQSVQVRVTSVLPVIDYIYRDIEGEHYAHMVVRVRPHTWEECDIKVSSIVQGGQALLNALGGKAGIPVHHPAGMASYMQTWYDSVRQNKELRYMRRHMGWQDDGGFVLGTDRYMEDGTVEPCTVSQELSGYVDAHKVKGDFDRSVELLDMLYNRPAHELYQFMLTASLASPLLYLIHEDPIGIPIALCGASTGVGKSTVCKIGISFWGNPSQNGQVVSAGNATPLAMYTMAGMRRHIPTLVDEATTWGSEKTGKFAYDYSGGIAKLQAKAEGGLRDNSNKNWTNFLFLTSNKSLTASIAADNPNCSPQLMRILEIDVPPIFIKSTEGVYVDELLRSQGVIGSKFIHYVVQHREAITAQIEAVRHKLRASVATKTDTRFWVMAMSCILVAFNIAKKLGIFTFNGKKFMQWTIGHFERMSNVAASTVEDPEGQLARLFAESQAGLLVTNTMGGKAQYAQIDRDFPPPRNSELLGRLVLDTGDLYLPIKHVRQWCTSNNLDYQQLKNDFTSAGWLIDSSSRMYLTSGTRLPNFARVRCWHIREKQFRLNVVGGSDG